jgi:YegS/Rv2252/BmrU family lipid kinase
MKKYERKKVLLMANMSAGQGSVRRNLGQIIEYLTMDGCEVTVYPVLPSHGLGSETIISEKAEDYDTVVVCGGDGSLNFAVNALVKSGIDKPIGYIPAGTTNDFARSLDGGGTLEEICHRIAMGNPFPYDIGRFNDRNYNYVAAFGAFTKSSYMTSQQAKNLLGYGAYVLNSIGSLAEDLSFKTKISYEYEEGEDEISVLYGSISNSSSVGGITLPFGTDTELDDGLFEVDLVKKPVSIADVANGFQSLTDPVASKGMRIHFKASHLTFTCDRPLPWTVDGEFGGSETVNEVINRQKALTIIRGR